MSALYCSEGCEGLSYMKILVGRRRPKPQRTLSHSRGGRMQRRDSCSILIMRPMNKARTSLNLQGTEPQNADYSSLPVKLICRPRTTMTGRQSTMRSRTISLAASAMKNLCRSTECPTSVQFQEIGRPWTRVVM